VTPSRVCGVGAQLANEVRGADVVSKHKGPGKVKVSQPLVSFRCQGEKVLGCRRDFM
jgi:hypothetical protein